jgi:hypothetical protein
VALSAQVIILGIGVPLGLVAGFGDGLRDALDPLVRGLTG